MNIPAHLVMDTFTWSGQPTAQWPYWLTAKNFATDGRSMIVIHFLEGPITVSLGETIVLLSTYEIRIR